MEIGVKKRHKQGIDKIQGTADVKEILASADLFESKGQIVQVCFRGEHCSGIIELSDKEAKELSKELERVTKAGKKIKILRLRE